MNWAKWIAWMLLIFVACGWVLKEWRWSQVVNQAGYRFNLAVIEPDVGVSFVSFDPTEKMILVLPFPGNLAISTRSGGEYAVSSLYKLGNYQGQGGAFVRQKIQGFMRVPVPGYLLANGGLRMGLLRVIFSQVDTSLSKFDAVILFYRLSRYSNRAVAEDELVRAGVVEDNTYHPNRLQEYVGTRLFDWGIGGEGVSVAIVNASGENGLGSDMADFLTNLGLDVVMVRSADEQREVTEWQVESSQSAQKLSYIFQNLFAFSDPKVEHVPDEYRSTVLVKVGKDAKELF
ncbi:MAG: LytR C-terminal domain-containing protein [bacterium]